MNKDKIFEDYITNNLDSAYRFAYTYVKNQKDAEDIVSESVIKALNAINLLKKPEYIKSWFYRIIVNTAINFLKTKNRCQPTEIEEVPTEDDHTLLNFYSIINGLEIKYREIIVLKFLEDMTVKEISETLKINENTVKTRLYRGLEILKSEMREDLI